PRPQGKLVWVVSGEVFDVAVDIRAGSPMFGRWTGVTLSGENRRQFWVPEGFAHGFVVTGPHALFAYKCTDRYDRAAEGSLRWDDRTIGIDWPVANPTLSDKDAAAPLLAEIDADRLPRVRS
ncbi:MAG: dTDP-4-dehydrorhamnose 3,5-epimerase, partial [Chloroflexota bacterium]|nr:dTDP-4-dehydrorhamnose 3,5-epimerase [Chloroflexota bacterium]